MPHSPDISMPSRLVRYAVIAGIAFAVHNLLILWYEHSGTAHFTPNGRVYTATAYAGLWMLAASWLLHRGPLSIVTAAVVIPALQFILTPWLGSGRHVVLHLEAVMTANVFQGAVTYSIMNHEGVRRWWRVRHNRCAECGYDLRGHANEPLRQCPECGAITSRNHTRQ